MDMKPIHVNYDYTNNRYKAKKWLDSLPDMFSADFEVASRFTTSDKELFSYRVDHQKLSKEDRRIYLQKITSDGLSHPSLTFITHLSIAWSDRDSFVIVCDEEATRQLVFNFLVETTKKQLWHNCSFDFKHIFYHTKKIPSDFVDTQLLAKSLLNDADPFKDRTSLKELMSYAYGDWAISKDNFTLEEMWDSDMIRYAATDSAATYKLYEDIMKEVNESWRI